MSQPDSSLYTRLLVPVIMPRPAFLVFLLMMIVLTSRIDWKPPLADEVAAVTAADLHSHRLSEFQDSLLKEKIILSQEQSIHKLNELVQTLKSQLELCRARGSTAVNNTTTTSVIEFLNEIE